MAALFTRGIALPHIAANGVARPRRPVRPADPGRRDDRRRWRSPSPAAAPTSPASAPRAVPRRRPLRRQRRQDLHHQRRARRLRHHRRAHRRRPGHGGITPARRSRRARPASPSTGALDKMGWHCSDTAELSFVDVRVPAANLVGEENSGFYQIAEQFVVERIALAVHAYGIAARALALDRGVLPRARDLRQAAGRQPGGPAQARRDAPAGRGRADLHPRRSRRGTSAGEQRDRRGLPGQADRGRGVRRTSSTRPCSCTAARATCTGPRWSGTTATPGSCGIGGGATEVLTDLAAKLLGYAVMSSATRPDRSTGVRRANREAMLDELADLDAEHAKARGRRRREVRRAPPRPRQAAAARADRAARRPGLARSSSCRPLAGWGSDFTGRRQRGHRHRRRRGRRVHDHRQRPDGEGRRVNPWTVKKIFRASQIAEENRLPTIALVESGGADLPTQKEIFIPGGKLFRDLTRLVARRSMPTIALVFGNSTAGGAYVPGMSDYTVMVKEQAKVFLGGPPLVKMATGEESDDESLGGAEMHARVSGLADYLAERRARRAPDRPADRGAAQLAQGAPMRVEPAHGSRPNDVRGSPSRTCDPEELLGLIPHRPQGAVRPARGDRADRRRRSPTTAPFDEFKPLYGTVAGHRLGAGSTATRSASSPTPRACCSARRRRRRPSSSSSPTRSTSRCCSCTTPPATWSARSTSRAASSSTAPR